MKQISHRYSRKATESKFLEIFLKENENRHFGKGFFPLHSFFTVFQTNGNTVNNDRMFSRRIGIYNAFKFRVFREKKTKNFQHSTTLNVSLLTALHMQHKRFQSFKSPILFFTVHQQARFAVCFFFFTFKSKAIGITHFNRKLSTVSFFDRNIFEPSKIFLHEFVIALSRG